MYHVGRRIREVIRITAGKVGMFNDPERGFIFGFVVSEMSFATREWIRFAKEAMHGV